MNPCQHCGDTNWRTYKGQGALPDDLLICNVCGATARLGLIDESSELPIIGLKVDGKPIATAKDALVALLARSESMAETRFERLVVSLLNNANTFFKGNWTSDVSLAKEICGLALCVEKEMRKADYAEVMTAPRVGT